MTDSARGIRRVFSRLIASDETLEAEELANETTHHGCLQVRQLPSREVVSVYGTVKTVTLRPRAGVPALVAEVWDGTGVVVLVWLGRRRIPGIEPGRILKAHGRVTTNDGLPTIYNPRYELKPAGAVVREAQS